MNKPSSYIYIFILVVAANASYLGTVSYAAILILILINLFANRLNSGALLLLFMTLSLVLFNTVRIFIDGKKVDMVVYNFLLQLIFLLTLDYSSIVLRYVFIRALQLQIFLSATLAIFGILFNEHSMFIDAGHAKGFEGMLALRGIFSTPQLMASICLAMLFLSSSRIVIGNRTQLVGKFLSAIMLVFTINRINFIFLFILALFKANFNFKGKLTWQFIKLLSPLITVSLVLISLQLIDYTQINLQTLQSRMFLLNGVLSEINFNSFVSVLFGDFSTIHFYIPQYQVDIDYVENGFLFLFKYFGVVGLIAYIVIGAALSVNAFKKHFVPGLYVFFYLFVVQNFTNEFVSFVFPQVMFLILSYTHTSARQQVIRTH